MEPPIATALSTTSSGADRQGLAENDALVASATTPLAPSLAPRISGARGGGVRTHAEHPVSERSPEGAGFEDQLEHVAGGPLGHLNGERARRRTLRRGHDKAPARLLGNRAQRVEDRAARLIDRNDGRAIGKLPLQPPAVRGGRPGNARIKYESDGENDDQLGCAHVRSPFAWEYGRARGLFRKRRRLGSRDENQ